MVSFLPKLPYLSYFASYSFQLSLRWTWGDLGFIIEVGVKLGCCVDCWERRVGAIFGFSITGGGIFLLTCNHKASVQIELWKQFIIYLTCSGDFMGKMDLLLTMTLFISALMTVWSRLLVLYSWLLGWVKWLDWGDAFRLNNGDIENAPTMATVSATVVMTLQVVQWWGDSIPHLLSNAHFACHVGLAGKDISLQSRCTCGWGWTCHWCPKSHWWGKCHWLWPVLFIALEHQRQWRMGHPLINHVKGVMFNECGICEVRDGWSHCFLGQAAFL